MKNLNEYKKEIISAFNRLNNLPLQCQFLVLDDLKTCLENRVTLFETIIAKVGELEPAQDVNIIITSLEGDDDEQ